MSSPVIKAYRKAVPMSPVETSHPNATESVKRSFKLVRLGVLAKVWSGPSTTWSKPRTTSLQRTEPSSLRVFTQREEIVWESLCWQKFQQLTMDSISFFMPATSSSFGSSVSYQRKGFSKLFVSKSSFSSWFTEAGTSSPCMVSTDETR